jgi:uncharacterized protein (TIGR00369 family)
MQQKVARTVVGSGQRRAPFAGAFAVVLGPAKRYAAAMIKLPNTRSCFCCGVENSLGLAMTVFTDRRIVESRLRLRREYAGFRGVVHGGIVATVLDEMMAWACGVGAQTFAYCGELNVRFLRPVRPEEEIVARGEVVENKRGRLLFCKAEIRDATGELLAEASGKYLPIKAAITDPELNDWVGDPSVIIGGPAPATES